MPGEFPRELARNFVKAIAIFFDGQYGFKVDETSYEGGDAATVRLPGDRLVRFDILMSRRKEGSLSAEHYYCEAKWRTEVVDHGGGFVVSGCSCVISRVVVAC